MPSSLELRLTKRAERDLHSILRYSLKTWGPEQQASYAAVLDRAMNELTTFPEMGRARDELGRGVRSLPVEQHVIFYRVSGGILRVVRVLHGRMEPVGRL